VKPPVEFACHGLAARATMAAPGAHAAWVPDLAPFVVALHVRPIRPA